jgi:hypothetical protein
MHAYEMSYKCQLYPTHTVATYIFVHSCHLSTIILNHLISVYGRGQIKLGHLKFIYVNQTTELSIYLSVSIDMSYQS